ncbi:hypothetical protein N0V95_004016 [Ascochyta clinopodiicola]|nr:hypothetical protein N0V95_004016 [Ascochyta clinopodiicola]
MSSEPLPDHYKILGIHKDADAATLKRTYRKLVLTCHPDRVFVTDEALKAQKQDEFYKVQLAYETLSDETSRAKYEAKLELAELRLERLRRMELASESPVQPKSARFGVHHKESDTSTRHAPPQQGRVNEPDEGEPHRYSSRGRHAQDRRYKDSKDGHVQPTRRDAGPQPKQGDLPVSMGRPEQPTITADVPRVGTLKGVRGTLQSHEVTALCDTGAQENCIRESHAADLGLKVQRLDVDKRPSFIMGHGKTIHAVGFVKTVWTFYADRDSVHVTFFVLQDCIFEILLGANFLWGTETFTTKRYRLCDIPRPHNGLSSRLVNLCGTPVRCLRGTLGSEECSALPDSGAEPNLISYEHAEKKGWLIDMYPGPESCRLLQFADGDTAMVSGRLRLHWDYLTGWASASSGAGSFYEFDVLRGCPFDVILGCEFLEVTRAFTRHVDSFHEVVRAGPSGMNIVVWVKSKENKKKSAKPVSVAEQDQILRRKEREAELQRLTRAEWPSSGTGTRRKHIY